jgi:polar amino acid transport system ATP-binding protein/sulfate transport system ATP-binding protein
MATAGVPIVLTVEDVWQKLGETQVLEGVTFHIDDRTRPGVVTGQVVALLGPSGVGKTRLIRLIAGLDAPDKGQIAGVGGKALEAGSVGVVFQNYPLLRHRTLLGNLLMAGVANDLSHQDAKKNANELLERFDLAGRAGHYPAQVSGGQRQRAAIAQQMMKQKQLLLMDEPFSGLDPVSLDTVMHLVVEVANMDDLNTVVVVTHDIRSALAVADTVLMLGRERNEKGKVTSGARIQKQYDLVAEGLAWRPDIEHEPRFAELERDVKAGFRTL